MLKARHYLSEKTSNQVSFAIPLRFIIPLGTFLLGSWIATDSLTTQLSKAETELREYQTRLEKIQKLEKLYATETKLNKARIYRKVEP